MHPNGSKARRNRNLLSMILVSAAALAVGKNQLWLPPCVWFRRFRTHVPPLGHTHSLVLLCPPPKFSNIFMYRQVLQFNWSYLASQIKPRGIRLKDERFKRGNPPIWGTPGTSEPSTKDGRALCVPLLPGDSFTEHEQVINQVD